jgi:hypothetical protein
MKRKNSARTNQPRHGAQRGEGIGKKLKNETTHSRIERFVAGDLVHIGLGEAHIAQVCLGHASSSSGDGVRVALYTHDFSRRTNQSGHQHCNVSDAGAKIQDTLTWTNARFTEQSFGERRKTRSLPDQALVLSVRAPE